MWFEEARTVWKDVCAAEFFDVEHSEEEDRYLLIGYSDRNRILFIIFQEKEDGRLVRIISARIATQNERIQYEEGI